MYAVTPNRDELAALTDLPTRTDKQVRTAALSLHDRGIELVWIRLGARGSILSTADDLIEIPAVPTTVEDVTGAGDSMLAAFCHVLLEGGSPEQRRALRARGRSTHHRQPAHRPSRPHPATDQEGTLMTTPHPSLQLTDEVAQALADGAPVVALESTIISHGMPYPQNVEMATEVERIIREGGAVPATIAVLDGRPKIGLDADALELLATSPDVAKVSVRDLPYVISRGTHGATTVAATMRLAALAGISVFVTGGLGGVHRGAPNPSTSPPTSPSCRSPTSPSSPPA